MPLSDGLQPVLELVKWQQAPRGWMMKRYCTLMKHFVEVCSSFSDFITHICVRANNVNCTETVRKSAWGWSSFSLVNEKATPKYKPRRIRVNICPLHPVQMEPTCAVNHVPLMTGFQNFAKLHPQSVGMAPKDHELFFGAASLGLRILMCHFRRCAESESAWTTVINVYTSKRNKHNGQRRSPEELQDMAAVLANIVPSPPREGEDTEVGTDPIDEDEGEDPKEPEPVMPDDLPPFWQVLCAHPV